jgi:hypothetical protein
VVPGNDSTSPSASLAPPKRQRVSRACDACRTAKEKCDGARPHCGRCIAQKRQCGYSSPEKRRGIRTGYLRAIELTLGLLLERDAECEKILLGIIHEHEEGRQDFLIDKESRVGEQLRRKWHKGRVYRGLDRLVSKEDGIWAQLRDDSEEDGDANSAKTSQDSSIIWGGLQHSARIPFDTIPRPGVTASVKSNEAITLKLPPNFRHLLDVYFRGTHCWCPLVDEGKLSRLAESYPASGVLVKQGTDVSSTHAQLWAAMAVAALPSSRHGPDGANPTNIDLDYIYGIARRLIRTEDQGFRPCDTACLLLLALARIQQSDLSGAWVLTGIAVRHHFIASLPGTNATAHHPDSIIFMVCSLLDTLLSTRLQRPAHMKPAEVDYSIEFSLDESRHSSLASATPTPSPVAALYQQFKLACILGKHFGPHKQLSSSTDVSPITELVQALESPFQFCNSLIDGGLTSKVPSAFLVQAAFLSCSSMLSLDHRPYLLGNLIEVTESYIAQFGTGTSPPLMRLYLELGSITRHMAHLQSPQRQRLQGVIGILTKGSIDGSASATTEDARGNHEQALVFRDTPPDLRTEGSWVESPVAARSMSSAGVAGSVQSEGFLPIMGRVEGRSQHTPNAQPEFFSASVDYDLILDELASLDYGDSVEPDPQFMANLGFAPGCEPNDLLGGEFPIFWP